VNRHAFTRVLVRKSRQALATARLILNAGDYDSAVNRSYYAVFDISRAALLKAGIAEDKLPRTHNGVSEAFRLHAVQSGLMDRRLAAELSRTESLRIKADYTDLETDPKIATEAVKMPNFSYKPSSAFLTLANISCPPTAKIMIQITMTKSRKRTVPQR